MSKSPGPKYALPGAIGSNDHDLRKKRAAAFSFGSRHKQFSCTVSNECSPGPTHFVKPNITRNGVDGTPKYSLYGRHRSIKVRNKILEIIGDDFDGTRFLDSA